MEKRYTHIRLNKATKEQLDEFRAPGQSYDGLLREIMTFLKGALPPPPSQGPPLPRRLGIRWPQFNANAINADESAPKKRNRKGKE